MALLQHDPIALLQLPKATPDIAAALVDHAHTMLERSSQLVPVARADPPDGSDAVIVELIRHLLACVRRNFERAAVGMPRVGRSVQRPEFPNGNDATIRAH